VVAIINVATVTAVAQVRVVFMVSSKRVGEAGDATRPVSIANSRRHVKRALACTTKVETGVSELSQSGKTAQQPHFWRATASAAHHVVGDCPAD
jgi:hypothetical protein